MTQRCRSIAFLQKTALGAALLLTTLGQLTFADSKPNAFAVRSIVFIDEAVRDQASLTRTLPAGTALYTIKQREDPFEVMSSVASKYKNLESISIISHATPGNLQFSKRNFDADALRRNGFALTSIATSLALDGDILLYGCDLGDGVVGRAFVQTLAALTDRDVAASSDATGANSLGGNWTLEVTIGTISRSLFTDENLTNYWSDLLAISVNTATSATAMRDAMGDAAINGITYLGTPTLNAPVSSNAFGTFTTSNSNVGISSGAIIGTGNVSQVPNTPSVFWDGLGTGVAGSAGERDVAALSYQFSPNTGVTKVVFQVVMGSEEYNEYVGQGFSDNIRILLSGGIYSNTNVATVPGTATGIDIDTINSSINSSYYRDNTVGSPPLPDSVLDGHTTVINTVVPVVPGTTYTSITTVADFIDTAYNTAAFLGFFGAAINLDLDLDNSSGAVGTSYTTSYTEGGTATSITDIDRTINNYDTTNIQSATITLTNAKSGDVLTIGTLSGGIIGSLSTLTPGTIVVNLSGMSTISNYQNAISAITFSNFATSPDTTPRNVTVVVNDGVTNSNTAITSISVFNVTTPSGNEFCTGANLANNGGIESPNIAVASSASSLAVPGWTSADPSGVEIWSAGHSGVPSHSGIQFIELNGSGPDAHTQTSNAIQSGAQLDIYFAHRARLGTDTASLMISDNSGSSTNFGNFSSTTYGWIERETTHVVGNGGNLAQLSFQPISVGSGNPTMGNFLDSVEICQTYLTLNKTFVSKVDTNADARDSTGDTIIYEYSIANPTGNNRSLSSISVVDDKIGNITAMASIIGDINNDSSLNPGETWILQASYMLTQSDIDAGNVINTAIAKGSTGTNFIQSDKASVTVLINKIITLSIDKSVPSSTNLPIKAGQIISYEYLVTNTGNVTLTNVSVLDDHGGHNTPPMPDEETIAMPTSGNSSDAIPSDGNWTILAPGDSVHFSGLYIVSQEDVDLLQ